MVIINVSFHHLRTSKNQQLKNHENTEIIYYQFIIIESLIYAQKKDIIHILVGFISMNDAKASHYDT